MKAIRSIRSYALAAIVVAFIWKCANLASLQPTTTNPIVSLGSPVRTVNATGSAMISVPVANLRDVPVAIQGWSEDVWDVVYLASNQTNNVIDAGMLAPGKSVTLQVPEGNYATAPKEKVCVLAIPAASRTQQVKDHAARFLEHYLGLGIPSWKIYVRYPTATGWMPS